MNTLQIKLLKLLASMIAPALQKELKLAII